MRVVTTLAAISALALLFGPSNGSAWAATECADLPPSDLKVYTFSASIKVEIDTAGSTLRRPLGGASPDASNPHPYLVIAAAIGTQLVIDGTTVLRGNVFCASPRSVHIGIGLIEQIVRLPRDAATDSCVRGALLEHAQHHADAVTFVTVQFVSGTEEAFGRTLATLKKEPAPTAAAAEKYFDRGVRKLVARAARALKSKQKDASLTVDTPAELEAFRRSCNGRVGLLARTPVAY